MKAFTVTTTAIEGIRIESSPYPHIGVGEQGRGRVYTRIPVERKFAESVEKAGGKILRASILRRQDDGVLVVEEKNSQDRRALVLANVPAGFRGGTLWEKIPDEIIVLASGVCAQGQAGRMGWHYVYLLIMPPNSTVKVLRTGRLYGAPPEVVIHWDGETLKVGEADTVFPPCDDDSGELI